MSERLIELCAQEFETHIRGLFNNPRMLPGTGLAEIPVIGGLYIPDLPETIPPLLSICAALCARERFRRDAPAWAPQLPLRPEDCTALENADSGRLNLVGYYGSSLRGLDWDYESPPSFRAYACDLMAYRATPDEIRTDVELLREFEPQLLAGLADDSLGWRTADKIAQDRRTNAWSYEMQGRRTGSMQAIDEWMREQLPMFCGCY